MPNAMPCTPLGPRLCELLGGHGFERCHGTREIDAFHAIACGLIPGPIAPPSVLARVQEATGSSLFLHRRDGAPEAIVALFAFSHEGETALRAGVFSGVGVLREWVSQPHPDTRLGYVWGFGGRSVRANFRILRALKHMRSELFSHIRLLARASTPEGRALMQPFGFAPSITFPGLFETVNPAPQLRAAS